MAVAPPIDDPIGYYARAQLVSNALAKGDLHCVLNGPMSARPPGTAFVLYPFGFKASIHRFLFRSVFAPILIWVAALGIPIITRVSRRSDAILGSAVIVGLATMPLFYHFELNEAVAALPTKQRQAVAYHYLAGLPYAEIAVLLDGSAAAARRAAADGIATLRRTYSHDLTTEFADDHH